MNTIKSLYFSEKSGVILPRSDIIPVPRDKRLLVASPTPIKSIVKAESNNANFVIFLSCIAQHSETTKKSKRSSDQEWEVISSVNQTKDWSPSLTLIGNVHDTNCHIPGYGEASVRL